MEPRRFATLSAAPRAPREYVHFRTLNSRCHRRMVSGVTSVATSRNTARPRRCPSTPGAGGTHRSTAVDVRSIVLSVHDSPREETRSHHVARARAIHTAPRAASVTDSRRESTRMCRPSFQTLRVSVVVAAGGGRLQESADTAYSSTEDLQGPFSAGGRTSVSGAYTTWWVCRPCAPAYGLTAKASKDGFTEGNAEVTVHIH